jgi:type II secretory pathway pseudopilin PulG
VRDDSSGSSGFSLIEAVVAIAIAGILLSAFAIVAVASIRGSTEARVNQQAGDILNSALESARAQSYSSLAMYSGDSTLSGDSRLQTSGCPNSGAYCISLPNPSGSSPALQSLVMTTATGAYITQHQQSVNTNTNHVTFTEWTYITSPTDEAKATYKEVTVYLQWKVDGQTHTRVASTDIASTQRGLPLPHFTLTLNSGGGTYNPGQQVLLKFTILNLGARDSFDFSSNNDSYGWTYYLDNGDGSFSSSTDTVMSDSDGDGVRDTGAIEPTKSVVVWVVYNIPSTATASTNAFTFTAKSVAQPNLGAGTSSHTQSTSVTVTSGVISTATPTPTNTANPCGTVGTAAPSGNLYYLHNSTGGNAFTGASSTSLYPMRFSDQSTAPTASSLVDFSTDDGKGNGVTGRDLRPVGASPSFTDSNVHDVAAWQYQVGSSLNHKTFSGTTYLDVWAQPGSSGGSISLSAMVGYGNTQGQTTTWTNKTTSAATATGSGCDQWREYIIAIPTNSFTVNNNDYLEVLLFNNSASADERIAYDTTTYMANVVWTHN